MKAIFYLKDGKQVPTNINDNINNIQLFDFMINNNIKKVEFRECKIYKFPVKTKENFLIKLMKWWFLD
jgi:hypothetical protein